MVWKLEWDERALKEFRKISKPNQIAIQKYLKERISVLDNPKSFGKPLSGNMTGLWRYRVSDYRIICNFKDEKAIIVVLAVGHRKQVYDF